MNQYPGTTWGFGNVFEPGSDSTPLGWWEPDRQPGADV
jgi:hypothetical protein